MSKATAQAAREVGLLTPQALERLLADTLEHEIRRYAKESSGQSR